MTYKDRTYDRFWTKVKKLNSGCWIWLAGCNNCGHGHFHYKERNGEYKEYGAHKFSWILHGLPDIGNYFVLHKIECGRPDCVNPEHLYLGTHRDNALDYWNNKLETRTVVNEFQAVK